MDLMKWFDETPTGIDGVPLPLDRIDTLEQILQKKYGRDIEVENLSRLRSRKNIVIHLRIGLCNQNRVELVAKMFVLGDYNIELSILSESWKHNLAVPEVIDADDGVILMSYIPGEPLVDRINRTFQPHLIDLLARWYYDFHSLHNMTKGDPRLRNFIYDGNILHGVDFEETCPGPWMLDIAGISASLLDTDPIFDARKRRLSWRLLDSYLSLIGKKRNMEIEHEFNVVLAATLKQTAMRRMNNEILRIAESLLTEGLPKD
jgi:hypothetical protein